jgi:hypothetical protein
MVYVLFRGPMIVFTDQDEGTVTEIQIPDGSKPRPGGCHPDGDAAKTHFAGALVANLPDLADVNESTKADLRLDLRGTRVRISDGSGKPCCMGGGFEPMFELNGQVGPASRGPLAPIPQWDFFNHAAARVKFEGGTLRATQGTEDLYSNGTSDEPQQLPRLLEWEPTPTSSGLIISIIDEASEHETRVRLSGDQCACIYHWDERPGASGPTPHEFMDFTTTDSTPCDPASAELVDTDFKWVYQLLSPPSGDWGDWPRSDQLPAPVKKATAKRGTTKMTTIGGRDCLGARWESNP